MNRILFLLLFLSCGLSAQVQLPPLLSEGVVLQRDTPLDIKGYASPGEEVTLYLDEEVYRSRADEQGNWSVNMPAHPAGGPYEIIVKGKNEVRVKNVLFGDVWLCAGQSNMVLNMERVKEEYPEDIASADYPKIRNFFVKTGTDLHGPRPDLPEGSWVAASPENVLGFGAVSFFFAREIYEKYQIPIGIINASVGGTPIEAWISQNGLKEFPALQAIIEKNKDENYIRDLLEENKRKAIVRPQNDRGLLEDPKWYEEAYTPKGWQPFFIPGYWEDQGVRNLDGVVWFRREIDVPASMCGVEAKLFMGRIVDADRVYVNGQFVGNITYQYPPRRYRLPAGMLRPGKNIVVVRVQNDSGKGGFVPDKPYYLTANGQEIDLKGEWCYQVGQVFEPAPPFQPFSAQNQPTALFNAMVAPLVAQTRLKGILWYQGESNTGNPEPYGDYLKALIKDYRNLWQRPDLPFLYVQLANFMDRDFLPVESNWAQLRQEQLEALTVPHTAMAVTIDLGEWNDIHPLNKKDVGRRLAKAAQNLVYGENDLVYSGPTIKFVEAKESALILSFEHTGGGLISIDDEPLTQFALAGADKKFVWATATIVDNQVIVSADRIREPKYVRYAWADNPFDANLYNREGLPASPFEAHVPGVERSQPGRFSQAFRDSLARLSAADHQLMKEQLGISVPNRPGPSGNPDAPNAANREESKVNAYVLPDPLALRNGKKIKSPKDWWDKRRPEIVEDFDREIYGRLPENIPSVEWKVVSVKDTVVGRYPVREKTLLGVVDNSAYPEIKVEIELLLATPLEAKQAVPVVLEFGFIRSPFGRGAATPSYAQEPDWKEQLISRGWGYAILVPNSIQADNGAGLRQGIIGLANKGQPRKPDDWGALRAWAWGASKAIDYFATDRDVDTERLAIEGLSRYGKAALVAMAYEPRFSLGFIGSSGAGGAKILRRIFGEQVENLASTAEYHWFCGNFIQYASTRTPDDLPVDAHQLVALCAPRPVFISSGSPQVEGQWVDAKGMFLGGVHAGPVYEFLGKKGLGTTDFPVLGTPLIEGEIAFRQHAGGHTTGPNWSTWIAWACRYWGD